MNRFLHILTVVSIFIFASVSNMSASTKRSCIRALKTCGHDSTDDTELLNQLFSYSGKITIPAGTYYVDATKGVRIGSNTKVTCKDGVEFRCIPNNKKAYNVFLIQDAQNVQFRGGRIIGDRNEHIGTEGEHGMGISIMDSKDVLIANVQISDTWGDAIYVGSNFGNHGGQSENIKIQNSILCNCRRQGVSVVACNGFTIIGCEIYGIGGTAPESGIDIEVNYRQFPSSCLIVDRCNIHDCNGASIIVGNPISDLRISNCTLDKFISSRDSKNLQINNCNILDISVGGYNGRFENCHLKSVALMNYGMFFFSKCSINRLLSSKNTGIKDEELSVSASFENCNFVSPTENLTQEGRYAYECMAYFVVKPMCLSFNHCVFTITDAWGLEFSTKDSLRFTDCNFIYKPSRDTKWGAGYGFLHLVSEGSSIVFEDNNVDATHLRHYSAYGLIRTYAPLVMFNRNIINTSVENVGTYMIRANNAVNEAVDINDNAIQGYSTEGVFREGVKKNISRNKMSR